MTALAGTPEERTSLDQYAKGIQSWGRSSWGDQELAQKETSIIDAFAMVHRDPEGALRALSGLSRDKVHVSATLMRSAQLLSVAKLKRYEEVFLMINGMLRSLEGKLYGDQGTEQEVERLKLLRSLKGTFGRLLNREDAKDELVQALIMPSARAQKLTKRAMLKLRSSPK